MYAWQLSSGDLIEDKAREINVNPNKNRQSSQLNKLNDFEIDFVGIIVVAVNYCVLHRLICTEILCI
ncbi:hypothetical protein UNDKW_3788 [Undibacterium sp. KW1]|nr:hypothetical protein UNDKW_3788 [Undibacterium sp. KW1]